MNSSEKIKFSEERKLTIEDNPKYWEVLISDDDKEVHIITEMVFKNFSFMGKPVKFSNVYTGEDTKKYIADNPGTALILLDVVMERENSGLDVVKYIREDLNNKNVRIILRTGHPGQAPEKDIVIGYDINDYKEKTELSAQKLITSVISSLRAFKDIQTISDLNENLAKKVEERTAELAQANSLLSSSVKKMQDDLDAGKKIQQCLLPKKEKRFGSYSFDWELHPSLFLSGDFLDYIRIDERFVLFYFADVCGHGASSAFVTVLLKTLINSYVKQYKEDKTAFSLTPKSFLDKLNKDILNENLDKHLTIFFGIIDTLNNEMQYANCGQYPYPVFVSEGKIKTIEERAGMPLGLFKFAEYKSHEMKLPESFSFWLFSDGILEIIPHEKIEKKLEMLHSSVAEDKTKTSEAMAKLKVENAPELPDDIAVMLIKRTKDA